MSDKAKNIKKQLLVRSRLLNRYLNLHDKITSLFLAVFIGILVALAAILFRYLIQIAQFYALGDASVNNFEYLGRLEWWKILLSTVSGGIIISAIYRVFMQKNTSGAIAEVMEANAINQTKMSLRQGLFVAVSSAIALGTGSSAGREGPVVHLGATLSSWVAQNLHLSANMSRTIFGCGVAAAVSASFNAPIAGVFFALEVILGHYALRTFAPIVIASVTAAIISRMHFGDFPAFILPEYDIMSIWEFPAFMLLGAISALTAIIFIKAIFFTENIADKIPIPIWARPPVGGLAVGLIALLCPYVLGVGYGTTDNALKNSLEIDLLLVLIVAKIAATSISLVFRYGTGIFSPSLLIGALVGSTFGYFATMAFPELASDYGLYAIVGMGAVSSAVLGAPISTILIIFELTGDYQITIALMTAVVIANLITTHYLEATSYFHLQLKKRGLDLEGGRAKHLSQKVYVRKYMKNDFITIDANTSIKDIRKLLINLNYNNLFIIDKTSKISGIITISELRDFYQKELPEKDVKASDIYRILPFYLKPSDTLEHAFRIFDQTGEDILAIVSEDEGENIIGVLSQRDVLRAYNKLLIDTRENT
ncbi:MAG: chloride channel protein [Proteobacteria bacterium]|jgi:chloride channel protein, CIC family|nr:chloride channel protein [Pseudomonadota bacterium]